MLPVLVFCFVLSGPSWALLDPDLARRLETLGAETKVPVQVVLKEQFDSQVLASLVEGLPRPVKRARVGRILQDFAEKHQRSLLAWLEREQMAGRVTDIHPLWLVNAIGFSATRDVILAVNNRPDVDLVYCDRIPVDFAPLDLSQLVPGDVTESVQPNLVVINARGAWAQGSTGQGIVIGVVDTGVRYTHLDLKNHLWKSDAYPNCGFNFASNQWSSGRPGPSPYDTLTPLDYNGHGTHCAGIATADGAYGNGSRDTMGVAPSALIMSVPVDVNISAPYPDTSLENNVMQGMQFCVRPPRDTLNGADVITMSLGLITTWQPRYAVWRRAEENVLVAGIAHIVAAGNEGNSGIRTPGNCPPPWPNPANHPSSTTLSSVITVGATDNFDEIASFSSRGPTRVWGNVPPWNDYTYPPGLTDPDVVAPGVQILSTAMSNDQAYVTMTGTSMATPAVAGCVALMLSRNPELTPREIDSILERHSVVDLGSSGKDNVFGAGRINCSLAVAHTPPAGPRHDVALVKVLAPASKVEPHTPLAPRATVRNAGTYPESDVVVHCRIDSLGVPVYNRSRTVTLLDSAAVDTVTFPDWSTGPGSQTYQFTFWHAHVPDTNRANDTIRTQTTTRGHDIIAAGMSVGRKTKALLPIRPAVTLSSTDYTERGFRAYCRVDSAGTAVYRDSLAVDSVAAGESRSFTFPNYWNVGPVGVSYDVVMWHNCWSDENRRNDTLLVRTETYRPSRILILYADVLPPESTLGVRLKAMGDSLEYASVLTSTPKVADLRPYDAVGVFSRSAYYNKTALGDTLAAYVDLGGGVVIGNFSYNGTVTNLAGRVMTGDYAAIKVGTNWSTSDTMGWRERTHPIMAGVDSSRDVFRSTASVADSAETVALWSDGRPYVAVSRNQKVVGINQYPGVYSQNPPQRGGDWARVWHNALLFVAGLPVGARESEPLQLSGPATRLSVAPSPVRRGMTVSYAVPAGTAFRVGIYDLCGRLLCTLATGSGPVQAGRSRWDLTDAEGRRIARGIYFCRLVSSAKNEIRKVVVE
ncbi:MAG: S8 family serine peptidase [candidate division WOR-3 bacterium]